MEEYLWLEFDTEDQVLFMHIFTVNRAKLSILLFFVGWGLRVNQNSDIFEKLRSFPGFQKFPNFNRGIFVCFSNLPHPMGNVPQIFSQIYFDGSPK